MRTNITLEDLFKHSLLIWTNKEQLDFSMNRFQEVFGMTPTPLAGLYKHVYPEGYRYQYFRDSAVCCSFSHIMALRFAQMNNWPFVCIFEQDAYSLYDDKSKLELALSQINDSRVVLLGNTSVSKIYKSNIDQFKVNDWFGEINSNKYRYSSDTFNGYHAYIVIGQEEIGRQIERIRRYGLPDNLSFNMIDNGLYSIIPFFCQHNLESHLNRTIHKIDDYIYWKDRINHTQC